MAVVRVVRKGARPYMCGSAIPISAGGRAHINRADQKGGVRREVRGVAGGVRREVEK